MGSKDVHLVGLLGMKAIGKTTIAEILYSLVSGQFDHYYSFCNVREESEKNEPIHLRKKLLSQLLGVESINIEMLNAVPTFIKDKLGRMKVVVVLDDISDQNQSEASGVGEGWFGPGSRIILTSSDKNVLYAVDGIYIQNVKGLNERDSLELLSMKAFKQKYPPQDYAVLATKALHYARGHPLVLKQWGSHLCRKTPNQWEIELNILNQSPTSTVERFLERGFEGRLDDVLKDLPSVRDFLDESDEGPLERILEQGFEKLDDVLNDILDD